MASGDPITFDYTLRCSADDAFGAYTERISEWWHPGYTANADTLQAVTIEPSVGGRVYATHSDMGEHEWGEVTAWEPGRRLTYSFTLAQDPQHPTKVDVAFVPSEAGCTVQFAHSGWSDINRSARQKFADWPTMLDRFAALAEGRA